MKGLSGNRNLFRALSAKEPFPREDGKRLFWEATVWKREQHGRSNETFSFTGKQDSFSSAAEPRQHSDYEPEHHGNEGQKMAQARRVGDEADDRRAEREAEEPDGWETGQRRARMHDLGFPGHAGQTAFLRSKCRNPPPAQAERRRGHMGQENRSAAGGDERAAGLRDYG